MCQHLLLSLDVELLFLFSDVFFLEHLHGIYLVCLGMLDQEHLGIRPLSNDTEECKVLNTETHKYYLLGLIFR